jgi:hypothetical protein
VEVIPPHISSLSTAAQKPLSGSATFAVTRNATDKVDIGTGLRNHGAGSGTDWTIYSGEELGNWSLWKGTIIVLRPPFKHAPDP